MKRLTRLLLMVMVLISIISFTLPVGATEGGEETVTAQGHRFDNVPFSNGYNGFCLDANLGGPVEGREYIVSDTSAATNNNNNSDVSQSLKILFTQCFDEIFTKTEQGYIILDEDVKIGDYYPFNPSSCVQNLIYHYVGDNPTYQGSGAGVRWDKVVKAYNGPSIPDNGYQKTLANGDVITFSFIVLKSGNSALQDMFAYKLSVKPAGEIEPETTEATIQKVWDDANDQDGKRPDSLTVTLSNGTEVTLNEANGWKATVSELPKYKDGVEIEYTWSEVDMPEGYKLTGTKVEGTVTTLTNSHTPETTEATIQKVWDDANDQDGKRPESLTVTSSDGTEVTLNEANGWKATVSELPKYKDGVEIEYTWSEVDMPEGYTLGGKVVEGTVTTLTNSHTPETTEATIQKVWDDANDQDGKRPDSLTVTLSDGTEVTLNEANGWKATVSELPKYEDGVEIEYTWSEVDMPEGYTLGGKVVEGTVTTLTNSHTPETTEATIQKVWDDANDQDGKRPESLTVTLSDGTEVTLNEANGWKAIVTELPKYKDGVEIEYTWSEVAMPEGYKLTDTKVEGTVTTLTNSYDPEIPDIPEKPDKPDTPEKPVTPDTGDYSNIGVIFTSFVTAWMLMLAVIVYRRKQQR